MRQSIPWEFVPTDLGPAGAWTWEAKSGGAPSPVNDEGAAGGLHFPAGVAIVGLAPARARGKSGLSVQMRVNDPKLRDYHSPVCNSGGDRTGCHREWCLPDDGGHVIARESSDSVTREKSSEGREFQASPFLGISGNLEELPKPSLVGRRAQFQKMRSIPHELLAELVHQPVSALSEIVIDSAQSPKPDHVRLVELHSPKARHVGSKRVGEDKGIEPIVLGAGNGVAPESGRAAWD
jgi:hypothetical protein